MTLSNDDRGWIMTALSGLACIVGASFICIDILIRQFPGQRNFRIQDSDVFLSLSLSLSFGVMLFSALYKMLPSSRKSLEAAGYSAKEASWILIACFIGGVVGIQILSRLMHSYMSHDIVDCGHTHQDEEAAHKRSHAHDHHHEHDHDHHHDEAREEMRKTRSRTRSSRHGQKRHKVDAHLLTSRNSSTFLGDTRASSYAPHAHAEGDRRPSMDASRNASQARPSLPQRLTQSIQSLATGRDPSCNLDEPCFGFSDLCGPDCFRKVNQRGARSSFSGRPNMTTTESTPLLRTHKSAADGQLQSRAATEHHPSHTDLCKKPTHNHAASHTPGTNSLHKSHSHSTLSSSSASHSSAIDDAPDTTHHHHVPTNAFLSIGLQTSIAIALHKLPEGFITYATNHANPQLGASVFLALFIHNITEGFALALPLYLAMQNRLKAMLIAFALGGLSQPLGAAIAALWFRLAGSSDWAPEEGVYGAMFAVTAGIMASVALQLFGESLELSHSKNLCFWGAFVGMAVMGVSSALTA